MKSKCIRCNVDLVEKKDYKLMISVGNPTQVPVVATFEECPICGDRQFNEKEGFRIAKFVEKALKSDKVLKAHIGTKVEIVE